MNLAIQLDHLAAMDAALTTLTAGVHAFDCGPRAVAALIALSTATAEARIALTEQLMAWPDSHYEDPDARSVIATARAMLAGARFGVEALRAAPLKAEAGSDEATAKTTAARKLKEDVSSLQ